MKSSIISRVALAAVVGITCLKSSYAIACSCSDWSTLNRLDFCVGDFVVGTFHGDEYPSSAGWYAYEPYRCTGHAILSQKLEEGETVTLCISAENGCREFIVDDESFDINRPEGHWQVHILRFIDMKKK